LRDIGIVLISIIVCPFNTSLFRLSRLVRRFSHYEQILETTQIEIVTFGSVVPK